MIVSFWDLSGASTALLTRRLQFVQSNHAIINPYLAPFARFYGKDGSLYDRPGCNSYTHSSAVITRSTITQYCTRHFRNGGRISISLHIKNTPYLAVMGDLWVFFCEYYGNNGHLITAPHFITINICLTTGLNLYMIQWSWIVKNAYWNSYITAIGALVLWLPATSSHGMIFPAKNLHIRDNIDVFPVKPAPGVFLSVCFEIFQCNPLHNDTQEIA